ncbi:MAG: DUF885 domain-containing protein [Steroidobacteraceae bacterium]
MVLNRAAVMCSALLLGACSRQGGPVSTGVAPGDGDFARAETQYVIYFLSHFPVVATYLGGSALDSSLANVDGRLRNYSAQSITEEDARLTQLRKQLAAIDADTLSGRRRVDREVALAQIDFLLHEHQVRKYQQRSIDSYVDEPFRGVDFQLISLKAGADGTYGEPAEWDQVLARLNAIPAYLQTARDQLQAGIDAGNTPDWRVIIAYGLRSAQADADYFQNQFPAIARQRISGERRDERLAQLQTASRAAAAAYRAFSDWVVGAYFVDARSAAKATDASALQAQFRADRYAFGAEEYDWALKNNLRVKKSAAQLYDESWPIVQATQQAMIVLAAQIAKSHRWKVPEGAAGVSAVFDHLSSNAPANDAEMVQDYRKVGARIVQYARDTGLFDVPDDYKLDVMETPPALRSSIEGAAYYSAPPFKPGGVGRFYVTPTGNDKAQLRQDHSIDKMADLAAHEGFPGHDWHYKVMIDNRDGISVVRWLTPGAVEDSSSMWADSMAAEGWALYSEALLAEPQPKAPSGFYTPEEHLAQLQGQLYRDLRVRIDTGLHTGKLGFAAATDLFSEVVDFLPGSCADAKATKLPAKRASCASALAAVNRYARWPTQAITYRLGKDQIFALRERAQKELGERFSAKEFHLAFMRQGTISPAYFGDQLIEQLR